MNSKFPERRFPTSSLDRKGFGPRLGHRAADFIGLGTSLH